MDTSKPASEIARNHRVLVIDDNRDIHNDVRKILCPPISPDAAAVASMEAELFGAPSSPTPVVERLDFTVDSAYQGRDGLAMVRKALAAGLPYAMAFVDVRMPPGWDGVETTLELWKIAPDLQIVICTAHSDYSWDQMLAKLGSSDRLLILKKPFDTIEILQLANGLTSKWNLLHQIQANADQLEQRVLARTAALQEEIERRTQIESDLKRAKEAAEAADRAKSAFLANMSHEVRTPMNGVIGMANLLLQSPLSPEQRDLTETLCQSGESLLTIINDVLDFSKIEAGRMTLEKIDFELAGPLENTLDLHATVADRKGVELVLEIDPAVPRHVRGDPVRLRQIMLNLVGNAVKFTPTGEVVVRVALAMPPADCAVLRFEVTDTGIGIPEEVQAALFQPFVQADTSTTRKYGGTGLGLAICKRLVELMDGEMGVSSTPEHGSAFWFTVKLERATSSETTLENEPAMPNSTLDGRRILIVDDNAANRKLLSYLLASWKALHRAVDSGTAALDELKRASTMGSPYDLVILDYHMPGMDGVDLATTIRADKNLSPLLLLLTSRGERLTVSEMQTHGLCGCELKPVHPEKLRLKLCQVFTHGTAITAPLAHASAIKQIPLGEAAILIAEDNAVNQKVALLQLRNLGYAADVVPNGREVLAALRLRRYSLVLMDAQMPEMDGIEATRAIRKAQSEGDPDFPESLRIVAMTANAMNGDREIYINAGMDDYLAKPLKLEELRNVLLNHLPHVSTSVA